MKVEYLDPETEDSVSILCPGCGLFHVMPVTGDVSPKWQFNGSLDKPTITPSINATLSKRDGTVYMRCHSFITDGRIKFLEDSTHELSGKTIELPEIGDS